MEMLPVISSNISKIGHKGNVLRVQYHHGGTYEFSPVSIEQFGSIMKSDSKGKAVKALGINGVKL